MNTFAHTNNIQRRTIAVLSILLTCAVIAYVAFILITIFATASRADAERASRDATARIAVLELQYLTLDQGLSREEALARGFVEPVSRKIVYVESKEPKFSFNAQ